MAGTKNARPGAGSSCTAARRARAGPLAWLTALLVAAGPLGLSGAALAASFLMEDGRRLDGEVVHATRNTLMVRSPAGGVHQLALSQLQAVEVTTDDGRSIRGRLAGWSDGVYEIEAGERIVRFAEGRVLAEAPLSLPSLTVRRAEAPEGAAEMVFELVLSRPAKTAILVIYATFDGTAKAGLDYRAEKGALSLPPGDVKAALIVTLIDDELAESDETFELFVAADKQLAITEVERAIGTILNDDE